MHLHQGDETESSRLPWLSMAATILLFAGLLGVFRQELIGYFSRFAPERAEGNATLQVRPAGDSLQIVFPRGARKGVLSIQDGEALHRFKLSDEDLARGRFSYRSASPDLTIRLEADGRRESARVLRQPEVEAAAAQSPPTPPQFVTAAASQPDTGAADRAATAPALHLSVRKAPTPFPQALRSIRGTLRVDVQVVIAADGSVQSATLSGPATSVYFRRISLEAAQASRFDPSDGGASRTLRYEYTREGVQVSEAPAK
jgi:hypothetical protein